MTQRGCKSLILESVRVQKEQLDALTSLARKQTADIGQNEEFVSPSGLYFRVQEEVRSRGDPPTKSRRHLSLDGRPQPVFIDEGLMHGADGDR